MQEDPNLVNKRNAKNTESENKEPLSLEGMGSEPLFNEDQPTTSKDQPTTSKEQPTPSRECLSEPTKRKLQLSTPIAFCKKKSCSTPVGNDINSAIEKLDDISKRAASISAPAPAEDCFDHFGRCVASLLRSLPQDRSFPLQASIISMILEPSPSSISHINTEPHSLNSNYSSDSKTTRYGPPSVENTSTQDSVFSQTNMDEDFIAELSSAISNY